MNGDKKEKTSPLFVEVVGLPGAGIVSLIDKLITLLGRVELIAQRIHDQTKWLTPGMDNLTKISDAVSKTNELLSELKQSSQSHIVFLERGGCGLLVLLKCLGEKIRTEGGRRTIQQQDVYILEIIQETDCFIWVDLDIATSRERCNPETEKKMSAFLGRDILDLMERGYQEIKKNIPAEKRLITVTVNGEDLPSPKEILKILKIIIPLAPKFSWATS